MHIHSKLYHLSLCLYLNIMFLSSFSFISIFSIIPNNYSIYYSTYIDIFTKYIFLDFKLSFSILIHIDIEVYIYNYITTSSFKNLELFNIHLQEYVYLQIHKSLLIYIYICLIFKS